MPALAERLTIDPMDHRMIAVMRLVLAASALLIIAIDPSEPEHYGAIVYVVLGLYVAYSTVVLALAAYRASCLPVSRAHWVDVGWYGVLIGLSSGPNSIFFYLFFFAILIASFQSGFMAGLRVVLVSVALFMSLGLLMAPAGVDFDLKHFLLRPIYLLVFGYMMACWGGAEITLKRRLALLKDVSTLPNPRFGSDYILGSIMERLRTFYEADTCLVVLGNQITGEYTVHRADRSQSATAGWTAPLSEELAHLLLAIPPTQAMVVHDAPRLWEQWHAQAGRYAYDITTGAAVTPPALAIEGVLEAKALITVPLGYREQTVGRLYLMAPRYAFDASDVAFLLQVFEHTMPVIENIRLIDRLASDAAEVERQRIARDLHDSIIQPYIGLQMGLAALRQKLLAGRPAIRDDLERLMTLTDAGLADLRHYMGGLRLGGEHHGSLVPAVQRFAKKFAEVTGMVVDVEAQPDLHVSDRLAAEVFQMVAEGLSNVRRHTSSNRAAVVLTCDGVQLTLRIENDATPGLADPSFMPRSITERAAALGGCVHVKDAKDGDTAVVVNIPL